MIVLADILRDNDRPPEESLSVLNEALRCLDGNRSPHILYGCKLQVTYYSLKASNVVNARLIWDELQPSNHETTELRRRGLGGLICLADDKYHEAGEVLESVGNRFIELGMPNDAAILMLYRGEAFLRLHHFADGIGAISSAYQLLNAVDTLDAEKKALRDLTRISQVATADQLISRIRRQAYKMGGCLPACSGLQPPNKLAVGAEVEP